MSKSCSKHIGQEGGPCNITYYNSAEPFLQRSKLPFRKQCPNCRVSVSLARTPQKAKTKNLLLLSNEYYKGYAIMYNVCRTKWACLFDRSDERRQHQRHSRRDRETAARYKHDYTTSSRSHETKENWKGTPKQARFIGKVQTRLR